MKGHHPHHNHHQPATVSGSAIGTLTVPTATLEKDLVLQVVIKAASSQQLTVKKVGGKNAVLHLELLDSTTKLLHRNSILRCLCGMGLHNVLDMSPHFLLGGHASPYMASPYHAMALASLSSWMSVADTIKKSNNGDDFVSTLEDINNHLEYRAFLIDSPQMTLADLDVATSVATALKKQADIDLTTSYPHLMRWLTTIQNEMKVRYDITLDLPTTSPSTVEALPKFFFGNETGVEIPRVAVAEKKEEADKKDVPKKQPQQQQQQASKKKKEPAAAAASAKKQQQQQAPTPSSFDISASDIRVGQIVKVWPHPDAEKLFCEEINVGEDVPRQIASGLRPFYKQDELENRRVVVLCNLKKRNLVGFPSHGMVLCASNADHTQVQCMEPPTDAKIGERVTFDSFVGEPEPENKIAKKKIFEAVSPDLKTNGDGVCVWKNAISQTSAGPIKASKGMPNAQVS